MGEIGEISIKMIIINDIEMNIIYNNTGFELFKKLYKKYFL